ncbi:putative hydrolase of HD superfamily [Pontibacter ummariensis]|uniref:Putative hydrolases of HD superfamily n=1 Tax=Pontibacter ummariensis TaxID=1610492 RepID=A0A239K1P0_9BACT|nr:HD domain-containing protein [Pontibacter ummariensis]PRY06817.1 putative hydrolase of HD superfamily [Pontibacter ummariensis]SNT11613.1 putative hydrolases of HD superfamily [Pontibacter ummariensis]
MKEDLKRVLEVLHLAEKLKYEMRHSWLSNGRQESVAEHTWRMSLMVVLLEPYLDKRIDIARTLKMVIIHDLVEAEAGDVPAFEVKTPEAMELKRQKELQAIANLRQTLGEGIGEHVYELWHEFEEKATYEAKVAHALDKLEVRIQHNHADIATWLEIEQEMVFLMGQHTAFDTCLSTLKELIEELAVQKMEHAGIDVTAVKARMAAKNLLKP